MNLILVMFVTCHWYKTGSLYVYSHGFTFGHVSLSVHTHSRAPLRVPKVVGQHLMEVLRVRGPRCGELRGQAFVSYRKPKRGRRSAIVRPRGDHFCHDNVWRRSRWLRARAPAPGVQRRDRPSDSPSLTSALLLMPLRAIAGV